MPQQANLEPVMNADEVNSLLTSVYPQLNGDYAAYSALEVFPGGCTVRLDADERHLRPGGTVSGPSLFTLADIGGYVCVLSHAGPDALSVTTSLNINFLSKPSAGELLVETKVLKLGKRLAVGEVFIFSQGVREPVSHATVTYSIPSR